MKTEIIVFAIIALIYFGVFNGLIIRLANEADPGKKQMWSKWWHRCALFIRATIMLVIFLVSDRNYLTTGIVLLLTAIEYNVSINLINNLKWYYLGTTAKTDLLLRKLFPFIPWMLWISILIY